VELTEFLDEPRGELRPGVERHRTLNRRARLSAVLFALTCVSTFLAGLNLGDLDGVLGLVSAIANYVLARHAWPALPAEVWWNGVTFSACVMSILLAHEMGHFLQAVRHRVPATLPFFIPLPIGPFGTMGAVIVQDGRRADRRQLFDIAISGPLAGLVVALPILCYGIATSHMGTILPPQPGYSWVRYGDPLLIRWIVEAFHGPYGPQQDIGLNAPLFAGWVGIFITALNLLPVGQLDGGHILYTLIGRRAHVVAYLVIAAAVGWMVYTHQLHYALIVVLILLFGPRHPPTANDRVPLGIGRTLLGWLTLAFIIIGFTPTPIVM
jgi:membrane-associated protease RseP (regulator of RpoE activity)